MRALSMANKAGGAGKPDMALIKELREASGAPVVDCKNALAVSVFPRGRSLWCWSCCSNVFVGTSSSQDLRTEQVGRTKAGRTERGVESRVESET